MSTDEAPAIVTPHEPRSRRRWGGLVAVLTIFGLTGFTFCSEFVVGGDSNRDQRRDPRPAPDFSLRQLGAQDRMVALTALRGRPVVVNFWASWCVPCRKELPAIQRVADDVDSNVAVIGVNHLDNEQDALDFAKDVGITFPTGYDRGGEVAPRYRLFGMPTTVFIDERGRIVHQKTGEITETELREKLNELFGSTADRRAN